VSNVRIKTLRVLLQQTYTEFIVHHNTSVIAREHIYTHTHKYFRLLSTRVVCATFQTRFYWKRLCQLAPFPFPISFRNSASAGWVRDLIAYNPLPSPLKFPAAAASLIELPFRINDKETRWRGASTQIHTHTIHSLFHKFGR